tara:strand:+ start:899 stop:3076 length:2178 start_codon:yes stop_codon:yes gene_type:complete
MINSNAQYSGLANIMNMRDRNPNTQLAYVPNGYLNSVPTAPNPYTGIPQVNSPIAMNEGGMPSQQYPMQEEAGQLSDRGRYGDTTLVHMTPGEVQGLASLGQLTINPDTGLPEAFSLRSIIPMAASVIGGVVAGPAGAAIGSGLGTLATGGSGQQALLGAAMSFGMGYAMQGFGGSIFGDLGAGAAAAGAGATGAAGAGAAGAGAAGAGASGAAGAGAASEAALQSSLSTFGTGVGGNVINPATGIAPISTQLAPSFEASIPTISSDFVGPSAYEMAAYNQQPAMQTLGGDLVGLDSGSFVPAYKGAGFPATAPSVTPPSSAEMAGYRSGLAEFSPIEASPELSWVERNIYNSAENVGGEGEGFLESYLSPNRSSLPKDANLLQKYGPLGAVGIGGLSAADALLTEEQKEQQLSERKPVDNGFGKYTLAGGEVKRPIATEEELRRRAVEGGSQNYFNPYTYVRNAAEGGIVGLQQGGMATPQAPSAMSAMLASPMQQQQQQQQPVPVNIAVQPTQQQQPMQQQPMPIQGMPMQGIQPLPDQSIAFKKNMDMEEQLQQQRTASSIQGQSALLGLISGGGNYLQSQGMNYPTTTPSGTIPQAPAMNQGTQVNMGTSGGFAQGGLLGYNEGGMPSQEQGYFEGQVVGAGDGQSDEVPFNVAGGEVDKALLSPDEYVLAADVVSYIGDGSSNAGAAKLDQFMVDVRKQAHGSGEQIEEFDERGLATLVA